MTDVVSFDAVTKRMEVLLHVYNTCNDVDQKLDIGKEVLRLSQSSQLQQQSHQPQSTIRSRASTESQIVMEQKTKQGNDIITSVYKSIKASGYFVPTDDLIFLLQNSNDFHSHVFEKLDSFYKNVTDYDKMIETRNKSQETTTDMTIIVQSMLEFVNNNDVSPLFKHTVKSHCSKNRLHLTTDFTQFDAKCKEEILKPLCSALSNSINEFIELKKRSLQQSEQEKKKAKTS